MRVLAGEGTTVCRRKAVLTVASLVEVEQAALTGATPGTCLEVVMEGDRALLAADRGVLQHPRPHRVSGQLRQGHDLRRVLSRHAKSNGIDADALARLPLVDPAGLHPLQLPDAPGRRWTAACAPVTS